MGFEEVRCPLDVHCKEVEVTPWHPLVIQDVPISATFGFHKAMYGVLQPANNYSTLVLPMLCGITIYYSYLKMLYSYRMQPLPSRHVYAPSVLCSVSSIRISTVLISMHLTWLLACIHAGTVLFVRKIAVRPWQGARATNTLRATMEWPEEPSFPPCFSGCNDHVWCIPFTGRVLFLVRLRQSVSLGLPQQGRICRVMWPRWLCTPCSMS